MTQQSSKQEFYVTNNSQDAQASAATDNPRIIQLDAILNRSRFIWARENSQQASNNN